MQKCSTTLSQSENSLREYRFEKGQIISLTVVPYVSVGPCLRVIDRHFFFVFIEGTANVDADGC